MEGLKEKMGETQQRYNFPYCYGCQKYHHSNTPCAQKEDKMDWKDTVMSYRECQSAKLPTTPPFTDDERIAQAQAERTETMLKDEWIKEGRREVVEWTIKRDCSYHFLGKKVYNFKIVEDEWQAKVEEWFKEEVKG